jgi:ribosome biogenesis ATPase
MTQPRTAYSSGQKTVVVLLAGIVPLALGLAGVALMALWSPELPQRLGVRPVAGILLHGPPGCGKTTLAHAIANETGVPFYKISAPEVVSGVSGMLSDSCALEFAKCPKLCVCM